MRRQVLAAAVAGLATCALAGYVWCSYRGGIPRIDALGAPILVAIGACAVNGGIPAIRNAFDLAEVLDEAYVNGVGVHNPGIPNDPEIPLLLNKVHPIHEVVKVDYFLPGCPPSGDTIWTFLTTLLAGKPIGFPYTEIHYD